MTTQSDSSEQPKALIIPIGKSWRLHVSLQISRLFWLGLILLWLAPLLLLAVNWDQVRLKVQGVRALESTEVSRLDAAERGTNTPTPSATATATPTVTPAPAATSAPTSAATQEVIFAPTATRAPSATSAPTSAPAPTATAAPTAVVTPTLSPDQTGMPGELLRLPLTGASRAGFLVYFDGRVVSGGSLDAGGRGEAQVRLGVEAAGPHTITVRERDSGRVLAQRQIQMLDVTATPLPTFSPEELQTTN